MRRHWHLNRSAHQKTFTDIRKELRKRCKSLIDIAQYEQWEIDPQICILLNERRGMVSVRPIPVDSVMARMLAVLPFFFRVCSFVFAAPWIAGFSVLGLLARPRVPEGPSSVS